MDATTVDVASEERPSESVDSSSTQETVPAETVSDASAGERPTQDSTDDLGLTYDLDGIPEDYRDLVKSKIEETEKGFRKRWIEKTTDLANNRKEFESKQSEYQRLAQIANEVLQDPAKLDTYRKLYLQSQGIQDQPTAQEIPQFETMDDLNSWMQKQFEERDAVQSQKIEQALQQRDYQQQVTSRWDSALNEMRQDPVYSKFEKLIVNSVKTDPKYQGLYTGANEKEMLELATEEVKLLIEDQLQSVKKETIESIKSKKEATTVLPRKTVKTEKTESRNGRRSAEEIIKAVNERLAA